MSDAEPATQTVLLIEDNPHMRLLLERMLASVQAGGAWQLRCASRLADAHAVLAAEPVAVILLDLSLPDARGFEALIHLHSAYDAIPIVVLTGHSAIAMAVKAIRHGATDYLVKGEYTLLALLRTLAMAQARTQIPTDLRVQQLPDGTFEVSQGAVHITLTPDEFRKRLLQQSVGLDCLRCMATWLGRGTQQLTETLKEPSRG